jgi:hypothetical protein
MVARPTSMGYELRRLLDQYGVSTPTMAPYTGTSAADAAAYDKYASDYQNRLANTNMYNQAQFNTTGVNFPAFPTYSGAQNVLMAPTPMVPTPMAQVPMVQAPMAQAPVASSPAEAGSGSPAPMAGSKPNMREFMDATGADFQTASEMLYGVVGSNTDTRDWGAIMSSGNPVTAAAQATGQMYNNPASTAFNLNRSTTDINLLGSDPTKEALRYNNPTGQAGIVQTPEGFAVVSADGIALRGGYGTLEQAQQAGRMFGIGPAQNYAQGGSVKGYRPGGPVDMLYGGAGDDEMMGRPAGDRLTTPAPAPVDPMADMRAMLDLYAPSSVTSEQIAAAAERRVAEQKAFEDILRSQLQGTDGEPMSKAEKYFRLAAAFGAPTKTGHFAENLSLVGEEMADQLAAKAQREREARERGLGVDLEIQKMRMAAAGEDFEALQGVQSEEAKYRRDVAKELLKEQTEAGKNKFRRATAEEAAAYNAAAGQFGPDGRFYAIDVPQGMTIESDGAGGVRFVQGPVGTGGSGKPTEGQLAGAGYLQRMTAAEEILRDLERREGVVSIPVEKTILMDTGIEGYVLNSAEQQVAQAQRDWVRSKLRKESGAVIGAEEMAAEIKTYFPQPGEGPEVIAQKAEARRRAERQMQIGSGTAAEQAGDISQPYAAPIRADELARAGIGGGPASQPVVIDGVTIRKVN